MFTALTIGTRDAMRGICTYLNANNQTAVFSRIASDGADVWDAYHYESGMYANHAGTFGSSFDAITFARSIA